MRYGIEKRSDFFLRHADARVDRRVPTGVLGVVDDLEELAATRRGRGVLRRRGVEHVRRGLLGAHLELGVAYATLSGFVTTWWIFGLLLLQSSPQYEEMERFAAQVIDHSRAMRFTDYPFIAARNCGLAEPG